MKLKFKIFNVFKYYNTFHKFIFFSFAMNVGALIM
jgi:hypothetical protein